MLKMMPAWGWVGAQGGGGGGGLGGAVRVMVRVESVLVSSVNSASSVSVCKEEVAACKARL